MKKSVCFLFALMMTLFMMSAQAVQSGIYTGEGQGNNGPIVVDVTFADDVITNVQITEHAETPGVCDAAIATIA